MTDSALRIGIDMSILRHPRTGSARWAIGIRDALASRSHVSVTTFDGFRRLRGRHPVRKVANLVRDEYWCRVVLPRGARRAGVDALLMPVNISAARGPIPQVVTIHDVNFLSQRGTYDRWYARYAAWAFRRSLREADVITTVSNHSRGEIAAYLGANPDRIRVIHPGLAPPPTTPSSRPVTLDRPYALYVGATEPHKNVGLLVEAWAAGSPAGLALAIVGQPGRDDARLRAAARRTSERVTIVGAVDGSELEAWYRGASVFLFPSRTEGFGYPPLEAMQRGIPVIAARAGALPEILEDAALFHSPDDVQAVRDEVERVIASAGLREKLIERGHDLVRRYTWDSAAARMLAVLMEAVAARSG